MVAPSQLVPGTVFARDFRVLSLLAEGGMGAVYVSEQLSTGKRRALKVMLAELVRDPRARQRFELEARIAAQIESEHVVEVVGAGVDEGTGTPWLAMELLEGQDLAKIVASRGLLSRDEVLTCFQQMGHALGLAHQKGIVHRDLKPENLFLATSRRIGSPFTLKVLDFGIAKLTQESRATSNRTAAMGSPLWMAPEQTEQAQLTPGTDVWAMGLIAFFLLTGRLYWRSAHQSEVRLASILTELLVSPLDPPSVRAAQLGVGEPLPVGFDAWFARCVVRDPSHRFVDAAQAVAALGPGMSHRDGREASQPFQHHGPAPRVAPTVPLAAFPSASVSPSPAYPATHASPIAGPASFGHAPGSSPGPAPSHSPAPWGGSGTAPGHVAPGYAASGWAGPGASAVPAMHSGYVQAETPARPPESFSIGRLVLYTAAFVLALSCTGGITFGALHAWQAVSGLGTAVAPPPRPEAAHPEAAHPDTAIGARPPEAALTPMAAAHPDVPVDAGAEVALTVSPPRSPGGDPPPETTERAFAWADGEAHVFRGNGRFTNGIVCDFTLTLNRNGETLDGFFHWTVREVPPAAAATAHVGQTIDEAVTGSWAPPACNIHTVGTAAGTTMRLRINGDGRLSGRDDGGTRYSGRLSR